MVPWLLLAASHESPIQIRLAAPLEVRGVLASVRVRQAIERANERSPVRILAHSNGWVFSRARSDVEPTAWKSLMLTGCGDRDSSARQRAAVGRRWGRFPGRQARRTRLRRSVSAAVGKARMPIVADDGFMGAGRGLLGDKLASVQDAGAGRSWRTTTSRASSRRIGGTATQASGRAPSTPGECPAKGSSIKLRAAGPARRAGDRRAQGGRR